MPMFHETKPLPPLPPTPSKDGGSQGGASGSGVGPISPAQAAKEKTQARRAQVRKAQIQHRQRKANYIKQLELDIVQIRDMIAGAERESKQLRNENAAIRQKLTVVTNPSGGMAPPVPIKQQSISPTGTGFLSVGSSGASPVFSPGMQLPPSTTTSSLFSDPGLDDITVSLQIDEAMDYPCFQFTRNSSPSSGGWDGGSSGGVPSPPQQAASSPPSQPQQQQLPNTGVPGIDLTPEQTDQAINFILALEHICWGHFQARDFAPDADASSGRACAHTLMASHIALAPAPPQVFKQLGKSQRNVWFTPSALHANPISGDITWKSGGLSLQSLYGLATSLNPGDKELTPVQAWFELARTFDVGLLLSPPVADRLKRELHGVVKCIHYGAVIERGAFESVVGRVIGESLGLDSVDVPEIAGLGSPELGGGFGMGEQQLQQQIGMGMDMGMGSGTGTGMVMMGSSEPGLALAGPSNPGGMI